jgi:hypothetical protein
LYELTYPGIEGSVMIYMMPNRVKDARGPGNGALSSQRRIIEWFKKAYLDKYGVRLGFVEWKKLEVQRMSHSDKTLASLYSDD